MTRCRIHEAVDIPCHPAQLYALLADVQDAEPLPRRARIRMVKEPTGPTTVGTRWHEEVRLAPLCWLHVESIVTDAQEPHRLAMDFTSRWWTGQLTCLIEPTSRGCTLHHRETLRPRALLRPFAGVIQRRLRPKIRERLDDIRHHVIAASAGEGR